MNITIPNSAYTILISVLFVFCGGAEPNIEDMKRVQRNYLDLRFQKSFNAKLSGMNDEKLMELSCAQNHVKCDKVLQLLKKNEPDFYKKFTETN